MLGGTGSGLLFGTVNVVTAAAAYYTYEVSWNVYGPPISDLTPPEAVQAGVVKTLLYRVVSTARNLALGYAFTQSAMASLGFALVSNAVDIVIYGVNEYAWYVYGPATAPTEDVSFLQAASDLDLSAPSEDTYRVSAMAVGAVAGVIIVNVATGGAATPVMALGASATVQSGTAYLGSLAITAFAAVGGAYAVDWLYQWY